MIPKKIHYCWFGGNSLSSEVRECIASWRQFCPDYEIIEWNEKNFDVDCIRYTADAYRDRRWAYVTDYARLKIVYEQGGIYLDTDVELLRPLDPLLENKVYFGMQRAGEVATGLGFGAEAGAELLRRLMAGYESYYDRLSPCNDSIMQFGDRVLVAKTNWKGSVEAAVYGFAEDPKEGLSEIECRLELLKISDETYADAGHAIEWCIKNAH